MTDDYFRYLKYKSEYLDLKHALELTQHIGGNKNNLVIHISGPSGSGKTTLGDKLRNEFGNKIIVKDFDDLRREFFRTKNMQKVKMIDKDKYQLWIDNFVSKQKKPLILTGLNHMPWWHKTHYYNTHAQHKYYINLNSDIIFKQKCKRFISDVFCDQQERLVKNLTTDNKKHLKGVQNAIGNECNYDETIKMNQMWNHDYKKQGYEFLSREHIFKEVSKIIKKEVS